MNRCNHCQTEAPTTPCQECGEPFPTTMAIGAFESRPCGSCRAPLSPFAEKCPRCAANDPVGAVASRREQQQAEEREFRQRIVVSRFVRLVSALGIAGWCLWLTAPWWVTVGAIILHLFTTASVISMVVDQSLLDLRARDFTRAAHPMRIAFGLPFLAGLFVGILSLLD